MLPVNPTMCNRTILKSPMSSDLEPTHIPVLCKEMIEILNPCPGKVYVDGTFGGGGYTRAILNKGAEKVIAFDRDNNFVLAEVLKNSKQTQLLNRPRPTPRPRRCRSRRASGPTCLRVPLPQS